MPDESRVKPQPLQPEAVPRIWKERADKAAVKAYPMPPVVEADMPSRARVLFSREDFARGYVAATIEEARREQPVRVTDEPGYTRDQAITREVREMLSWALKMPPPQRYEELIGLAESKMARMFERAEAFAVDVNRDLIATIEEARREGNTDEPK